LPVVLRAADGRAGGAPAHLTDGVRGGLPVRQWVLTLPHRLRYALAWDHRLCRAVLAVFVRAVLGFERRRARLRGMPGGTSGAVTAIQRFGSALNTNVHFHTVAAQGVFAEAANGRRFFAPAPAPSARDVTRLLAAVRRRIIRLVARHGIDLVHSNNEESDGADERLPRLPGLRTDPGRRRARPAGHRPARRWPGDASPRGARGDDRSPRRCDAGASRRLRSARRGRRAGRRPRAAEHLCRYVLRPPVAQQALEREADGSILGITSIHPFIRTTRPRGPTLLGRTTRAPAAPVSRAALSPLAVAR
jgi:hypothetical protein